MSRGPVLIPGAATAVALLITAALALSGALDGLEHAAVDARFDARGASPAPEVAVVAIDDASIRELGTWPLDRRWHARAMQRLHAAGARLIVYDVQFTEASPRPRSDMALYDAIGRAGGAVLATTESVAGRTRVLGGDERLRAINSQAGATNLPVDRGAVVRRYDRTVGQLRSLPVVAAERVRGSRLPASAFDDDGSAYIDFRGPPGSI